MGWTQRREVGYWGWQERVHTSEAPAYSVPGTAAGPCMVLRPGTPYFEYCLEYAIWLLRGPDEHTPWRQVSSLEGWREAYRAHVRLLHPPERAAQLRIQGDLEDYHWERFGLRRRRGEPDVLVYIRAPCWSPLYEDYLVAVGEMNPCDEDRPVSVRLEVLPPELHDPHDRFEVLEDYWR